MKSIDLATNLRFTNDSMINFCEALKKKGLSADEFIETAVMLFVCVVLSGEE
jgi:predicted RNase H-like nuclease